MNNSPVPEGFQAPSYCISKILVGDSFYTTRASLIRIFFRKRIKWFRLICFQKIAKYCPCAPYRRFGEGMCLCSHCSFLTSVLDGSEWAYSRPRPPGRRPRYPSDGRLGGPQNWSGCRGQKKSQGSNTGRLVHSQTLNWLSFLCSARFN